MKIGVVTGAGSGIGRACVESLAADVDHLIAVDLVAPQIDGVTGVACDVSDPESVNDLVRRVGELGSFRTLVHAAGLSPSMADARRVLQVNLLGTQYLLDAFTPLTGAGSAAVCIASSAAYKVAAFVTDEQRELLRFPLHPDALDQAVAFAGDHSGYAYALSKVGVIEVARVAADRWRALGARVVSVSPGNIDTPMGRREFDSEPTMREEFELPFARFGTPQELAAVARFLVSDAASFVSGVDLLVDGGMSAAGLAP